MDEPGHSGKIDEVGVDGIPLLRVSVEQAERWGEVMPWLEALDNALSARRHAQVGTQVGIGKMKVQIGEQTWEFDPHNARRVK